MLLPHRHVWSKIGKILAVMTWRLPGQVRSASEARHIVRDVLRTWKGPESASMDLTDDATLLVSELVTNAVLHGQSDVVVGLQLSNHRLRVEVADGSPELPVLQSDSEVALGGRGVALVDAYADSWGVVSRPPEGKTVWFELVDPPA